MEPDGGMKLHSPAGALVIDRFISLNSPAVPEFGFHAFAQPLLDHALIVEIPGSGQALDPGERARVDAQSDGDRLGAVRSGGDGGFHETDLRLVFGPKICLGLFVIEERHIFPIR